MMMVLGYAASPPECVQTGDVTQFDCIACDLIWSFHSLSFILTESNSDYATEIE